MTNDKEETVANSSSHDIVTSLHSNLESFFHSNLFNSIKKDFIIIYSIQYIDQYILEPKNKYDLFKIVIVSK